MAQGGVHRVLVSAVGGSRPAGIGPGTSPSAPKLTPILASLLSHRPTSPVFKVPVGGTLPTPKLTLVLLRFQETGSRLLISGSKVVSIEIGELVLQFFRLPPLPGIPTSQLPQSLDKCHQGLCHVHWHKMTYFEGTLTQSGGNCTVRDVDTTFL